VAAEPVSPDPGRDDDPAGDHGKPLEWLTEDEWLAFVSEVEPEGWAGPGEDEEPEDPGSPPVKLSARAARSRRRGPGQPGSVRRAPDASPGPSGAFATGHTLDVAPGGAALLGLAESVAGPDDSFPGTTDDELTGIICALDRSEAAASALKHAAVAELARRRPSADREPVLAEERAWDEFTGTELSCALADTRWAAELMLGLADTLATKLPGTYAAFRAGELRESKVAIIARAVAVLTPAEARQAEARVLSRAGRLTPGGLQAAIRQAVIAVAPAKEKERRERAARTARVERWAEDSGNAALAGRELPPADVLAADQRISWWARQLRQAGLEGDMDYLRAVAYADILLSRDSRQSLAPSPSPSPSPTAAGDGTAEGRPGSGPPDSCGPRPQGSPDPQDSPDRQDSPDPQVPPTASVLPAGFIGHVNLTVPVTTQLHLADRPGQISGIGPVDPDLARDLVRAASANPKTTWCVTVTDQHGHAIGHGCARLEPKHTSDITRTTGHDQPGPPSDHGPPGDHDPPGPPGGHGPPSGTGTTPPPKFTFTPTSQPGPPGGYGTWRITTGIPGQRALVVEIDPLSTDGCDHRFQARGHDPGVKLRHLAQIRHATCTAPTCRRPSAQADFEHNIPYEAGGRTCLCNGGPKCRFDHRLKQDPRWNVEQVTPGTFRWTAPSGRQYTTEPTRYPI
jgi:hypothetical protein